MKKLIWLSILVLILAGAWWWQKSQRITDDSGSIKIGFVGSLTGGLANWGVESKNSIALAVAELNAAGGVGGRLLEVIYEDGKCEGAPAASAAQKLISVDQVKILLPFCSLEAMTIAPITEQNKILLFAPAATEPGIVTAGDYIFRLAPSDNKPALALARLLEDQYSKVAIITEVSGFSSAFKEYILGSLQQTDVAYDGTFVPGTSDFRSLLTQLKAATPEAVIVNANTPVAEGLIMKQMAELGINLPRYGIYWGADPEFLTTAGAAAEGFVFYNFVADGDNLRVAQFLTKYEQTYGAPPPNPQFAILSYDAVYVLARAIEVVGYEPDKLRDYLYSMSPYDVLSGAVSFDENGDSQGVIFNLFEVKNGKPVLID